MHGLLVPMMMSLVLGLILCAVATRRSGLLPTFVPAMLVTVAVFDLVVQSTSLGANKWVPAISWALALVGLGYAGVKVLRMPDEAWGALYPRQLPEASHRGTAAAIR